MKEIKDLLRKGEEGLARSLLKWKLTKEGANVKGHDEQIGRAAESLVKEAHEILHRRGKNVLNAVQEVSREWRKPDTDKS